MRGSYDKDGWAIRCDRIESTVYPTVSDRGIDAEVRLHEPMLALDGGQDGLEFYRRIAGQAVTRLAPNGRMFLEIGCEQAVAVAEILQKQGYREVQVFQDLAVKIVLYNVSYEIEWRKNHV